MQNKKKPKDILTHKQFSINQRTNYQTWCTNNWLSENGFSANSFFTTDTKLLQAQQQAHTLLNYHPDLLTTEQATTLQQFQHLMTHKNTRIKLKPSAAYPIFNINTRINRQLFKQHRQLVQASH